MALGLRSVHVTEETLHEQHMYTNNDQLMTLMPQYCNESSIYVPEVNE